MAPPDETLADVSPTETRLSVADVRMKRAAIVGGIRRDEGDYIVRDGVMLDGVTVAILRDCVNRGDVEVSAELVEELNDLLETTDSDAELGEVAAGEGEGEGEDGGDAE